MNTTSAISSIIQVAPRWADVRRAIAIVATVVLIVVSGIAWHVMLGVALGSVR